VHQATDFEPRAESLVGQHLDRSTRRHPCRKSVPPVSLPLWASRGVLIIPLRMISRCISWRGTTWFPLLASHCPPSSCRSMGHSSIPQNVLRTSSRMPQECGGMLGVGKDRKWGKMRKCQKKKTGTVWLLSTVCECVHSHEIICPMAPRHGLSLKEKKSFTATKSKYTCGSPKDPTQKGHPDDVAVQQIINRT
jgi:hypothetical protein